MLLHHFARFIHPKNSAVIGAVVMLVSATILLGWLIHDYRLTHLFVGQVSLSIPAAIIFFLAGAGLCYAGLYPTQKNTRIPRVLAALILLVSIIAISIDVWLAFDQTGFGENTPASNSVILHPPAILGFLVISGLLWILTNVPDVRIGRYLQIGTALLATGGILILLSMLLNMDYLYTTDRSKPLPIVGSLLFILIAIGFWGVWRLPINELSSANEIDSHRIYWTLDILVTFIVALVAMIAFSVAQGHEEKMLMHQLTIIGKDKRDFFEAVLQSHIEKARLVSSQPALVNFVKNYSMASSEGGGGSNNDHTRSKAKHAAITASIDAAVQSFVANGFISIALTDTAGNIMSSAGKATIDPEQKLPLWGQSGIELLWQDGYILRTYLPLRDVTGSAGFFVGEQRLYELTQMHQEAIQEGETGDMMVCALVDMQQDCFPFRWRKKSSTLSAYIDGKPLPLTRAVYGESSTDIRLDFRQRRVIAATGPIGSTGLGLAVKKDMVELYAPIRRQFFIALPFLLLLVGASIWIIRAIVHPLVNALDQSRSEMKTMALKDALTGLANRILFYDRLKQSMARAKRAERLMAVMYVDLDNFKAVNDNLGHKTGDEVLIWTARKLEQAVRHSDTVARLGGDEFTIILEDLLDYSDAESVAKTIISSLAIHRALEINGERKQISASIGIAFYLDQNCSADYLLEQADAALYQCKKQGRAGYRIAPKLELFLEPTSIY
jgi:diguanylate cyclase (GGDEF)-like protein